MVSHDGADVGEPEGGFVSPLLVGADVIGAFEGLAEGTSEGELVKGIIVGAPVGCPVGCVVGCPVGLSEHSDTLVAPSEYVSFSCGHFSQYVMPALGW